MDNSSGTTGQDWNFREMKKSQDDRMIAGICGGFGQYSPIPAWLWRVIFIGTLFFGGLGLLMYLILWVLMPVENAENPSA